jgi:hypothetical protein
MGRYDNKDKRTTGWEFQGVKPSPFSYPGIKKGEAAPLAAVFEYVVRVNDVKQPDQQVMRPGHKGYFYEELLAIREKGWHFREGMTADKLAAVIAEFEEKLAEPKGGEVIRLDTSAPMLKRA